MARKQKSNSSNTTTTTTTTNTPASAGRRKKKATSFKDYHDADDDADAELSMTHDADGNDLIDVLSETFTMFSEDVSILDDPFHEDDDMDPSIQQSHHLRQEQQQEQHQQEIQQQVQNHHAKLMQCLNVATSLCTEKRSTLREKGLKVLFRGVTQYAMGEMGQDTLQSRLYSDILPLCLNGLRGSGGGGGGGSTPAEQYASCRILEATSIVLVGGGGDQVDEEYVREVQGPLMRVVKVVHRAVQVRKAALRALAMACFMGSWSSSSTVAAAGGGGGGGDMVSEELECVMDLCEEVGKEEFQGDKVDFRLRATAWECWALLGTLLGDACLAGDEDDDENDDVSHVEDGEEEDISLGIRRRKRRGVNVLPLLSECLDTAKDLELKCSVGQCLALIHEARLNLGRKVGDGENASERRYGKGSWDGSEWEVTMDEIKQRVAELSVESGKHMSKKVKKDQRATFREFMSTIVDDESPYEVVAFRGGQLTLTTWKEIIQLNFIRLCLQTGFQIQLMTNASLQMIFGADASVLNTITQLSQLEKRHTQSKTSEASKQAYNERNKSRKSKMRAKYSFLEADGDEF